MSNKCFSFCVLREIQNNSFWDTRDLTTDLAQKYGCSKQKIAGCLSFLSRTQQITLEVWLPKKLTFAH